MFTIRTAPLALAATLGLAMLVGCSSVLPTTMRTTPSAATAKASTAKTTTAAALAKTATSVAFTTAGATAVITSTSKVASVPQAKALATNDEALVEGASALMEQDETAVSYAVQALSTGTAVSAQAAARSGFLAGAFRQGGAQTGGLFGRGGYGQAPEAGQAVQREAQQDDRRPAERQPQQRPTPAPRDEAEAPASDEGQAIADEFENFKNFGNGRTVRAPRLEREAPEPAKCAKIKQPVREKLAERRTQTKQRQQAFTKTHPKYSQDEAMIQTVLKSQPWQPNADDADTLVKSGTASLTVGTGVSRKVAVLRVIEKARPHHLVHGLTDIADVYADGATKTVHWEKVLQEDGSFKVVYHHEYVDAQGHAWVTDWEKTLYADGRIAGQGSFTETDENGAVVLAETLTIGGTDVAGQQVTTTETTDTAATEETAGTTTEETATQETATEETAGES